MGADLPEKVQIVDARGIEAVREDERLGIGLSQDVFDFEGLL